ncbi:GAF domain-containing protein [Afipia felis]|uniref:GAF domain-containing protein n=2 Tax=Afipia felis TaxID=1035 RepID=A0A380WCI0_AFIFE|nr:GAF domain-containing protein [Afipia felis]EKS29744.1 hypothetical protein HMPREF9697_02272 [Afipia felis ATCC 53690]SUU78451.1 Uncharacterised protein [Afipia felis]SUU86516.1 Uncharacterised protein [Afipia felis]
MRRFLVRENIRLYKNQLASKRNDENREVLEKLLAEAEDELVHLENLWLWTCPQRPISQQSGTAIERILDDIVTRSNAAFGSVQLYDENSGALYLIAQNNLDGILTEKFAVVRAGDSTIGAQTLKAHVSIIIEDVDNGCNDKNLLDWTRPLAVRSIHTTPILDRDGKFVGVFSTLFSQPNAMTDRERDDNGRYAEELSRLFAEL